jgi:hypothetical protein
MLNQDEISISSTTTPIIPLLKIDVSEKEFTTTEKS